MKPAPKLPLEGVLVASLLAVLFATVGAAAYILHAEAIAPSTMCRRGCATKSPRESRSM
jgi:hypothetical protein